ncbi:MAG: ABC transporter permease [Oscillospiraceae bacterium]|jgi:ABC-2 type transport system permease protein|nr:ABC transporter permease [Oscillospiraceae bacterium]
MKQQRKQIMAVAGFTFREAVRRKSFWVTNGIFFLLILAACIILPQMGGSGGAGPGEEALEGGAAPDAGYTCYLINDSAVLSDAGDVLAQRLEFDVRPVDAAQKAEILGKIRADGQVLLLELGAEQPPEVTITTKDFMSAAPTDAIWQAMANLYRVHAFAQLGYDAAQSEAIVQTQLPLAQEFAGGTNVSNYAAGMALMLMMFLTIYIHGYGVAMSVATEKSTRVMETLIVSAKPTRILLGKCIGMGLVGLSQMLGVLLFSTACAKLLVPPGGFGPGIALPSMTFVRAVLLVVYFLLGYALFSMINSMCGAMVSKMEDLQSAMMPASMVSVFSFYGGYFAMGVGPAVYSAGSVGKLMMYIPFTAPYAAPGILLGGDYTPGLVAASIGGMIVAIVLVAWISSKVYAASVLHYGGRLKFGEVRKLIKG